MHTLFASLERNIHYGRGIEPVKYVRLKVTVYMISRFALRAQVETKFLKAVSFGREGACEDFPGRDIEGNLSM